MRISRYGPPEVCVPVVLAGFCLAWGVLTGPDLLRAGASGAVSALVAVAVVLVFRVEGVVSYGHFGLAVLAASTVATALGSASLAAVVPAVLIGAVAVSWSLNRWVFARLTRAPRVVGTLAGMLAMQLFLAGRLWWGRVPGTRLPPFVWHVVLVAGLILAVALPLLLRPLLRNGSGLSALAGLVAGAAGLLGALLFPSGTGPLSGSALLDFPVTGMATAMVAAAMAGFRDPATAVVSAFGLSIALETSDAAFGSPHIYQLALMPLLSAALLLRPKDPALSIADGLQADPAWPHSFLAAVRRVQAPLVVALVVGVPTLAIVAGRQPVVAELAGYCLVGTSLMMLMGWIGQVTLGQLGFAALGAWITVASGLPAVLGILLGALVATVLSPLVAYTAIRHAGAPAPVTSLAWGLFSYTLFTSPDLLGWARVLSPQAGPFTATGSGGPDFVVAVAFAVCFAGVFVAGRTRFVRVLMAARLDPGIAGRSGIVLPKARLKALFFTGFVAGTGGGLLGLAQHGVLASGYATDSGARLVTSTGMGGIGTVLGPALGAVLFGSVILAVAGPAVRFAVTGVLGLSVLLTDAGGIAALLRRVRIGRLRIRRVVPAVAVPPPEEPVPEAQL